MDVLQNIEFATVAVYRAGAALHDLAVLNALDAPVRRYHAEEEQRQPPNWPAAPGGCSPRSRRYVTGGWAGSPLPAHTGL